MSELPGRPNLDQLRRQARDLLRAAADGESSALARLRANSERVSLSAAQLALAREHGFASWPALHAEVERRLAELPAGGEGTRRAGARWSFGGAVAVETAAGTLYPGAPVAGPGHAGDLPGHLVRLCAFLTGHGPADGLPRGWSSIVNAADATDGPAQHLDIAAALPPVDDAEDEGSCPGSTRSPAP